MKNAGFINLQMSYRVDLNATLAKSEIKVEKKKKKKKKKKYIYIYIRPVNHVSSISK